MTKVAPSVLSADFSKLKEEIDTLEGANGFIMM
jgi:ribulose-phosphate 3-epimerase